MERYGLVQKFTRYPLEARFFIAASFINSLGSALMWPLIALYVHIVLHRSYADAGLVLLCQSFAGIFGQITGGTLYSRLGAKFLLVNSLILTGVAQIFVMFAQNWGLYMTLMTISGFLMAITMPVIQAFIGFRWKEIRVELFNVVYVSNNVGMAVGTTMSGLLATVSFSLIFLVNGISTIGFAIFFWLFFKQTNASDSLQTQLTKGQHSQEKRIVWSLLKNYRMYLLMGIGSMLVWLSTSAWGIGVAPFLNEKGMGMELYSLLWTINGIVIFAGQPVTSWMKHTIAQTLGARLVLSAGCYAFGFASMLLFHSYYSCFVVGMIVATFGEMLIAPTIPAFITEKAGNHSAFYLGVIGGFGSIGRLIGPYMYGNIYDRLGLVPILVMSTAMTLLAVISFLVHAIFHKDKRKSIQNSGASTAANI